MSHIDEKIIILKEQHTTAMEKQKARKEKIQQVVAEMLEGKILTDQLDIEVEKYSFFGGSVSMYMPKYFEEMTTEHADIKYPSINRPQLLYTNSEDTVNIGLTLLDDEVFKKEDIIDFRDAMLEAFRSVNPTSKILDKGNFELTEDTPLAYYTFDSLAMGGGMYNLLLATLIDSKILVVSLNCVAKEAEQNEMLFYGIMHSLTLA